MSVNAETLDRIKQHLKEAQDIGGKVPQDLYSHLAEVFNRILTTNPADSFENFEEISALVKQTHLKFTDPKYDFEVNRKHGEKEKTDRDIWVEKSRNLINEVIDFCFNLVGQRLDYERNPIVCEPEP